MSPSAYKSQYLPSYDRVIYNTGFKWNMKPFVFISLSIEFTVSFTF